MDTITRINPDKMSYQEVVDIGYPITSKFLYKMPHREVEDNGLVFIKNDQHVIQMMKAYSRKSIHTIVIYLKVEVGPLPQGLTKSICHDYVVENNKKKKRSRW